MLMVMVMIKEESKEHGRALVAITAYSQVDNFFFFDIFENFFFLHFLTTSFFDVFWRLLFLTFFDNFFFLHFFDNFFFLTGKYIFSDQLLFLTGKYKFSDKEKWMFWPESMIITTKVRMFAFHGTINCKHLTLILTRTITIFLPNFFKKNLWPEKCKYVDRIVWIFWNVNVIIFTRKYECCQGVPLLVTIITAAVDTFGSCGSTLPNIGRYSCFPGYISFYFWPILTSVFVPFFVHSLDNFDKNLGQIPPHPPTPCPPMLVLIP